MTSKAEPTTPGWRLVRDEEKLVIYVSDKLGISINLTKYSTGWDIGRTEVKSGMMVGIGNDSSKSVAIIKAKEYMELHPVPSNEVLLRDMEIKSPEKLFGISKVCNRFLGKV